MIFELEENSQIIQPTLLGNEREIIQLARELCEGNVCWKRTFATVFHFLEPKVSSQDFSCQIRRFFAQSFAYFSLL
jgi:hypothetical protein